MTKFEGKAQRAHIIERFQKDVYDLLIIGGGITGAGLFRDASLRGFRTVLLEKNDYVSGTSGTSSKLIHGGLRYLETMDWKLVFEALRERKTLLEISQGLTYPLPFLFPCYKGQRNGLLKIGLGVYLYHLLSRCQNVQAPKLFLSKALLKREKTLSPHHLKGGALYFDSGTHDGELTMANLRSGWSQSGKSLNHAEVVSCEKKGDDWVVHAKDRFTRKTFFIHARWVVNATGPWSDLVNELRGQKKERPRLRRTKGSHIVLPFEKLPITHAIVLLTPKDQRVAFALPWQGVTLVGTTDTDYEGDLDDVRATNEDVNYLLDALRVYFPNFPVQKEDILSTFAGLRPLIRSNDQSPSQVSREHQLILDDERWISIIGGKLTTYRKMAEEILDRILKEDSNLSSKVSACITQSLPLSIPREAKNLSEKPWLFPQTHLPTNERRLAMIRHEHASTLVDLFGPRTFHASLLGSVPAQDVAWARENLQEFWGWDEEEMNHQDEEFRQFLKNMKSGLS